MDGRVGRRDAGRDQRPRVEAEEGDAGVVHGDRRSARRAAPLRLGRAARTGTFVGETAGGSRAADGVNPRLRLVVGAVAVVAAVLLGYYVITVYQVWRAARHDGARSSQALNVLGAGPYNGQPSPGVKARLGDAADPAQAGHAPRGIVRGGKLR